MGYKIVAAIALLFSSSVYGSYAITDNIFTTDSDNVEMRQNYVGFGDYFGNTKLEVMYGKYNVSDYLYGQYEERDFNSYMIRFDSKVNDEVSVNGKYARVGDFNTGSLNAVYNPDNAWRFEAGYDKSIVDTTLAIDYNTTVETFTISTDYAISERWTAVGLLGKQLFSDDNTKDIMLAKLVYASDIEGLYYQAMYRYDDADFNPSYYFGPEEQQRIMAGVAYNKALYNGRFALRSHAMYGKQYARYVNTDAFEVKAALRGSVNDDMYMQASYLYSNFRGNINSGVDYEFQMFTISLTYNF